MTKRLLPMKTFFFLLLFIIFSCENKKNQTEELPTNLSLLQTLEENPIRSGQAFHLLIVQDTEELASEFLENLKENSLALTLKGVTISQLDLTKKILPEILRVDLGVNKQTLKESTIVDKLTSEDHIEFSNKKIADDFLQVLEENSFPPVYGAVLEHNKKIFLITKERKRLFEINPLQDIQVIIEKKGLSPEFLEELKETSRIRDTILLVNKKNIPVLQGILERKIFILENFENTNQSLILIKSKEKKETPRIFFATKEDFLNTHTLSPLEKEKFFNYSKELIETRKDTLDEIKRIKDFIQEKMTSQKEGLTPEKEKDLLLSFYFYLDFLSLELAQTTEALLASLESYNVLDILESFQEEFAEESIYNLYEEMLLKIPEESDDKEAFPLKKENLFEFFSTYIKNLNDLKIFYPESLWIQDTTKSLEDFLNHYKEKSKTSENQSE
jgi:hypothetical protein